MRDCGKTAAEYLRSADLMVKGLKKAHECYRPDGLPVTFDLQIEAEILGCELHWADEVPPSVVSHPLEDDSVTLDDLPKLDRTKGRLPLVMSALEMLNREIGEEVALYGLICGPYTLVFIMRGSLSSAARKLVKWLSG